MGSLDSLNMSLMLNDLIGFLTNTENILVIVGTFYTSKIALKMVYRICKSLWTYVIPRYVTFISNVMSRLFRIF